jgi:hypothetical protein
MKNSMNLILSLLSFNLVLLVIANPLPSFSVELVSSSTELSKRGPSGLVVRQGGDNSDLIDPPFCAPDHGKCQLMVQRWQGQLEAVLSLWDYYCNVIGYNNHVIFDGIGAQGPTGDTFPLDSELPLVTVVTTSSDWTAEVRVDYGAGTWWTAGAWPNAGGIYNLVLFDC